MKPIHELAVDVNDVSYHFVLYERESIKLSLENRFKVQFINIQNDDDVDGDVWVSIPHDVMEIIRERDEWEVWLHTFKMAVIQLIERDLIELKPKI